MTCEPTLGEQFLAEIFSPSNEKSLDVNLQDFHAEIPYLKDTMRATMATVTG